MVFTVLDAKCDKIAPTANRKKCFKLWFLNVKTNKQTNKKQVITSNKYQSKTQYVSCEIVNYWAHPSVFITPVNVKTPCYFNMP